MFRSFPTRAVGTAAFAFVLAAGATAAQSYDYGTGTGSSVEGGFLLNLEVALTNPRNADVVVATTPGGGTSFVPSWGDEPAGRVEFGYRFTNGARVLAGVWGFSSEEPVGRSGAADFTIGPFLVDSGTAFDIDTEIQATSVDVSFGVLHQPSETFHFEWSVALRYALYEETETGRYADGSNVVGVSKSNEGEMIGAGVGLHGSYRFGGSFSVDAGFEMSLLDGELTAHSSQSQGLVVSQASISDDSRSGSIRELDVAFAWHPKRDRVTTYVGWTQSLWEDIASDLMRNLPGTPVILHERDSVTFSGYTVGVRLRL